MKNKLRIGVWIEKDYRPEIGGGFGYYDQSGFQSPPINWSINTQTKKNFFDEIEKIKN